MLCEAYTYDAVIARSLVTPSAVDIERVDLSAPLDCLLQLALGVVHDPVASLQKPQQPARTVRPLTLVVSHQKKTINHNTTTSWRRIDLL